MSSSALVVRETDELASLAAEIGVAHRAMREAATHAIERAISVGDLLLRAKPMIPFGSWADWLLENCSEISPQHAAVYMRFARHREIIRAGQPGTIREARGLLSRAGAADSRFDPTVRLEARRMRLEGSTIAEIATALGVSKPTALRYCDPKAEERYRRERAKTSLAGRRALLRERRDAAVRTEGDDISEAYARIRVALGHLQASYDSARGARRRNLAGALSALHRAEDLIGAAVRETA